jgi:transcriptional regulator with XRE-family HTH domain
MDSWERIKKVMEYFDMNKNRFSKEIGMSNNVTIGRIINEKRRPSEATLLKIAKRFNSVNIDWLKTGKGEMIVKNKTHRQTTYLKKEGIKISLTEVANFVIDNEEEFMRMKGFKNMIELQVAKKLIKIANNLDKLKDFLKNE